MPGPRTFYVYAVVNKTVPETDDQHIVRVERTRKAARAFVDNAIYPYAEKLRVRRASLRLFEK